MINPWDVPAKLTMTPDPYEAIMTGLLARKKAYDEGENALTALEDSFLKINALDVDKPGVKQRVGEYQNEAYNIVDNYSNDLAAALPKIKQLQRKLNTDMSTGYLGGVTRRYNGYVESAKEMSDFEKKFIESGGKNGTSSRDAKNVLATELTNPLYNGEPIKQNADGTWESYRKHERMNTYNFMDKANEYGKWLGEHPEVVTSLTGLSYNPSTGYYSHGDVTKTVMTEDAIRDATKAAFRLDPEITKYIDWEARISGKHDAAKTLLENNPQGIPQNTKQGPVSMEPNAWVNEVYTPMLYADADNAASSVAKIYQRNNVDMSRSYLWNKLAEDARTAEKEEGFTILTQAPLANVPGTTLNPSFFDVIVGGATVPFTAEEKRQMYADAAGDPAARSAMAAQIARGKVVSRTTPFYKPLSDLSESQRTQVDAYLRTLEKDAAFKDAVARVRKGNATEADNKLVYPALKKMSEAGMGSTQVNSNLVSIPSGSIERPLVNQLLSGSSKEVITVKELSSGIGPNLKVTGPDGVPMTFQKFAEQAKKTHSADSPVTIQSKIDGANALTNATGDLTYANAYQINIDGQNYYLHGDFEFNRDTQAGREAEAKRVNNMQVAKFARAKTAPTGTFSDEYFGIPVEWVYMPDANNPDKGTYRLTGLGSSGVDANGNPIINNVTQGAETVFPSADALERKLFDILNNTK